MRKWISLSLAFLAILAVVLGCQSAPAAPTAAPTAAPKPTAQPAAAPTAAPAAPAPTSAPAAPTAAPAAVETAAPAAPAAAGVTATSIKLGLLGYYGGFQASQALPMRDGFVMRMNEINAAGGVNGRKFEWGITDTNGAPKEALAALKRMVESDKVFAIWGPNTTDTVQAMLVDITKYKVPFIETMASTPWITSPFNRYIFRPMLNHWYMAMTAVDAGQAKFNSKRPAILMAGLGYGRQVADGFAYRLQSKYGLKPVDTVEFPPDATDISGAILKLKAANPDVVYANGFPAHIAQLLRQGPELGLNAKIVGAHAADPTDLQGAGKGAKGHIAHYLINESLAGTTPAVVDFKKKFYAAYPNLPKDTRPNPFDVDGYAAADVVAEGVKRAGANLTVDSFIKAMETLKDFKSAVPAPPVTFTSTSHEGWNSMRFYEITGDNLEFQILPETYGDQAAIDDLLKTTYDYYKDSFSKEYLDLLKTQ